MSAGDIEIADVFRKFADGYLQSCGGLPRPEQRRAVSDILRCMTAAMGGSRYRCGDCGESFWHYHGCRNRSCPRCHGRQTLEWIRERSVELLPGDYFHVVTTIPAELRGIFLAEQEYLYGLLMKVSAEALCELAGDSRYLGAIPAIMSVLHTWTGQMLHHPHVHMLVSGVGTAADGSSWRKVRNNFLVPVKKLSPLVARRFRETLSKERPGLFAQIAPVVWRRQWCSFCRHLGEGRGAVMRYLGRYVYRVAITRNRIVAMDDSHVTLRHKDNDTGQWKTCRVGGVEFVRRFLLHVLPKGFHKVRYFGLWHSSKRRLLNRMRVHLLLSAKPEVTPVLETMAALAAEAFPGADSQAFVPKCPRCGGLNVRLVEQCRRGELSRSA
jgi:hypothetical protein